MNRDITIAVRPEVTTLINILTVEPERHAELVDLLRGNIDQVVSKLDGWRSTSLIVGTTGAMS